MKIRKTPLSLILCTLTVFLFASQSINAASNPKSDRTNNWEFNFGLDYLKSKSVGGDRGSKADLTSDSGFAMGFGFNFSEKLLLAFDANWHSPSYSGTRVLDDGNGTTEQINGRIDTSNIGARGYYHFLDNRFTPFVSASMGWTFVDSNIPTGEGGTGCWWDYYWGYVCNTYALTYTSTKFSYGVGLGLRMDLNRSMFIRGSVDKTWLDYDTSGSVDNLSYRFEVGFQTR
ncbi:MAG: outer membrane beta-barrel protein [Thiohalomonadales bacterium]